MRREKQSDVSGSARPSLSCTVAVLPFLVQREGSYFLFSFLRRQREGESMNKQTCVDGLLHGSDVGQRKPRGGSS